METNASFASSKPHSAHNKPIRDDTYFFDDGDCIFLVDGILFKLHKWFLCRDPDSMFRGMFSIPQGSLQMALDPILLFDDSAEEFRAICWVVYTLPDEIHAQTTRGADIRTLMNVSKMCHKYTFPVFESWALDMILIQCRPPLRCLATCPPDVLDRLMGLSTSHNVELLRLVEVAWISRLRTGELQFCDALAAGEKYGRRQFQGEMYYELNKQIHLQPSIFTPGHVFSAFNLNDKQTNRLLSGHVALSSFWTHVREDPLPPRAGGCTSESHHHCMSIWDRIPWDAESSDVIMGLSRAREFLSKDPASNPFRPHPFSLLTTQCVQERILSLGDKHATDISSYFLGPEIGLC
ncbi:hypothetical protein C8R43DRAFT_1047099 [Mycena crocata]|nr:hypothetical protein C8R43DRAFT_1047099 [Mycena crocata]